MKNRRNQQGFTIFELMLTVLLCALLAGIIVELIASPLRSYFWYSRQAALDQMGQQALENMAKELRLASPSSIRIAINETSSTLAFKNHQGEDIQYACLLGQRQLQRHVLASPAIPPALFANQLVGCEFKPFRHNNQSGINVTLKFLVPKRAALQINKLIFLERE